MHCNNFSGIIISHLGNLTGRDPDSENTLNYIKAALAEDLHVCVDVVYSGSGFLLPSAAKVWDAIPPAFLSNYRIWARATDPDTLNALCDINAHVLPQAAANVVLTSAGFLWSLPPANLTSRSIAAFPELAEASWLESGGFDFAGLCSNEPLNWRK